MTLTPDMLARLDLSDEVREVLQRSIDEDQQKATELAEYRKKDKETATKARLTKLSKMGFEADAGFLKVVSDLSMADDGDVAVTLLSDSGATKTHLTITQALDRLIEALPTDDQGKINLAAKTNLLENPLSGRPDLKPEAPAEDHEVSGDELLAQWQKALPGGLELAIASKSATTTAAQ